VHQFGHLQELNRDARRTKHKEQRHILVFPHTTPLDLANGCSFRTDVTLEAARSSEALVTTYQCKRWQNVSHKIHVTVQIQQTSHALLLHVSEAQWTSVTGVHQALSSSFSRIFF